MGPDPKPPPGKQSGEVDGGVLICGMGMGISLSASKVEGIRAVVLQALLGATQEEPTRVGVVDAPHATLHWYFAQAKNVYACFVPLAFYVAPRVASSPRCSGPASMTTWPPCPSTPA